MLTSREAMWHFDSVAASTAEAKASMARKMLVEGGHLLWDHMANMANLISSSSYGSLPQEELPSSSTLQPSTLLSAPSIHASSSIPLIAPPSSSTPAPAHVPTTRCELCKKKNIKNWPKHKRICPKKYCGEYWSPNINLFTPDEYAEAKKLYVCREIIDKGTKHEQCPTLMKAKLCGYSTQCHVWYHEDEEDIHLRHQHPNIIVENGAKEVKKKSGKKKRAATDDDADVVDEDEDSKPLAARVVVKKAKKNVHFRAPLDESEPEAESSKSMSPTASVIDDSGEDTDDAKEHKENTSSTSTTPTVNGKKKTKSTTKTNRIVAIPSASSTTVLPSVDSSSSGSGSSGDDSKTPMKT